MEFFLLEEFFFSAQKTIFTYKNLYVNGYKIKVTTLF